MRAMLGHVSKSALHCRIRAPAAVSTRCLYKRVYATVSSSIVGQPPRTSKIQDDYSTFVPPLIDNHVLQALSKRPETSTTLPDIIKQYIATSGTVLDVSLPYESQPSETRRPRLTNESDSCKNVVTVAHCVQDNSGHKITLSSGFALNTSVGQTGETLVLTCAHTLEEMRRWPLLLSITPAHTEHRQVLTGTFVLIGSGEYVQVYPVSHVVSALPRSDLLLLSCRLPEGRVNKLPVSPYPPHKGTSVLAHFVLPDNPKEGGWTPWVGDTWGKWVKGKVLGYRDFAGRESMPGTYDALSHLLFTPLPTAGSSGGPIIEEETGAVVGVMLGTRMDNRVEGVRGWGVPSESIFEMFTLPGLEGKR